MWSVAEWPLQGKSSQRSEMGFNLSEEVKKVWFQKLNKSLPPNSKVDVATMQIVFSRQPTIGCYFLKQCNWTVAALWWAPFTRGFNDRINRQQPPRWRNNSQESSTYSVRSGCVRSPLEIQKNDSEIGKGKIMIGTWLYQCYPSKWWFRGTPGYFRIALCIPYHYIV